MTITLGVREVLNDPGLFVARWRLAVEGVLLLHGDEFRVYQAKGPELDETVFLPIDDPVAAARLREVLPTPRAGNWDYFGFALVQGWTRRDPTGWVLHELVDVTLLEDDSFTTSVRVKIRRHPWGWDTFLG